MISGSRSEPAKKLRKSSPAKKQNRIVVDTLDTNYLRKVVLGRKKTLNRKIVSKLTKKCTCQGAGDFGVSLMRK